MLRGFLNFGREKHWVDSFRQRHLLPRVGGWDGIWGRYELNPHLSYVKLLPVLGLAQNYH